GADRIHHQGALHRRERAHTRIAALELLHDEPVGHVVEPGAAVLLRQIGAEQAELGHLWNQLLGKATLHVVLADDRHESLVDPGAHRVAHGALLLGEQAVDVVEVDALEFRYHMCLNRGCVRSPCVYPGARPRGWSTRRNASYGWANPGPMAPRSQNEPGGGFSPAPRTRSALRRCPRPARMRRYPTPGT